MDAELAHFANAAMFRALESQPVTVRVDVA